MRFDFPAIHGSICPYMKMIGLGGSVRTELRVDLFNVLNRANFGLPSRIVYAGRADVENPLVNAGLITAADAARQAQLSVRLSF